MLPLKRLLNEDCQNQVEYGYSEEWTQGNVYRDCPIQRDDTPSFANNSWHDIWTDILSTDISHTDGTFGVANDEAIGASVHSAEHDIESWIKQSLPEMICTPLEPPLGPIVDASLVCYGMIYRTAVKIEGSMQEIEAQLIKNHGLQSGDACYFNLENSSSAHLSIHFQDGTKFGIINKQASKGLEDLLRKPNLHFETIGYVQTIREIIGRVTKAPDAEARVNIIIYGPREVANEVGVHLTGHKLYLQRPEKVRDNTGYENPHVLSFSDLHISNFEDHLAAGCVEVDKSNHTDTFREAISNVYSSLTRGSKLGKVAGDHRIRTELLAIEGKRSSDLSSRVLEARRSASRILRYIEGLHQEEALDFMLQRENGPIPQEFCLWKEIEDEGQKTYMHAVTKAKSRCPTSEVGGGILADEMGMGKSLSILALITKTLHQAHDWTLEKAASTNLFNKEKICRATLVVVPSTILINEWFHEINIHLDETLATLRYHGRKRRALPLEEADIVITTYHTLVADFGDDTSPLNTIEWYRIVLDEAHIIRRPATGFFKAVTHLKARSRWCLTGTPIQNKLDDVGSLVAFLRLHPFRNLSMFRRFVSIPFDESDERREIATKNLILLLESLCLRRSKNLLHLPEPEERLRLIQLSSDERAQYEQAMKIMNRALRQKVGESYRKAVFGMFQIQLQLRILCNHGTYQQPFSWTRRSLLDERDEALCLLAGSGEIHCSACRQPLPAVASNDLYRTYRGKCAHVVCRECLDGDETFSGATFDMDRQCPICAFSGVHFSGAEFDGTSSDQSTSYLRESGYSSKVEALLADIKVDLEQSKSIVFSCWTNTLDLIERHLNRESIRFHRIDGESTLARKQKVLDDFSNSPAIRVLIMTTGTGAFGLNIMAASRVFIMEPQWNPSVEIQAIARAIRINQKKSVLVTRYMTEGTVEQEMRSQQKKKLMIAAIGDNSSS